MSVLGAEAYATARARLGVWARMRQALRNLVGARQAAPASQPYGPLTVGGLIDQLRRFDPAMRVIMPGETEDWTDVHEAHLDIFSLQTRHPMLLQLADDGDPKAVAMVRLFGALDTD